MAIAIEREADPDGRWITAGKRFTLATKEESLRLGVSMGHPLLHVTRVRQTYGRNDLVEVTVLRAAQALDRVCSGIAEERLSMVLAPEPVAALLGVPASSPVLKLDRIVRTSSGTPVELRLIFSLSSASTGGSGLRRKLRAQNC